MSDILRKGVNKGGSFTAAGAKTIMTANPGRTGGVFQNTSADAIMWLTETDIPAASGTGYKIGPGGAHSIITNQAISVFCSSVGATYWATEA